MLFRSAVVDQETWTENGANVSGWVIRPTGLEHYGETSIVFKAYVNGECRAESVMRLTIYDKNGVAAPMVANGANHTLALRSDGTVWAWGSNVYGQLGIATETQRNLLHYYWIVGSYSQNAERSEYWSEVADEQGFSVLGTYNTPQQVLFPAGTQIVQIAAGEYTSYALDSQGNVWAWGDNSVGQVGNGSWANPYLFVNDYIHHGHSDWSWYQALGHMDVNVYAPWKMTSLASVSSITAGRDYALALLANGTVMFWGNSGAYQSAEHKGIDATNGPVQHYNQYYPGSEDNRDRYYAEFLRSGSGDGGAASKTEYTYYYERYHRYGNYTAPMSYNDTYNSQSGIYKTTPVAVLGPGGTDWLGHNDSYDHNGRNGQPRANLATANMTAKVIKLVGGKYVSVALLSDGTVYAWGMDDTGKYDGDTTGTDTAKVDSYGTLGDGANVTRIYPVQVHAGEQFNGSRYLQDIVDVAAGSNHFLALDSTGVIYGWGANDHGQLGKPAVDMTDPTDPVDQSRFNEPIRVAPAANAAGDVTVDPTKKFTRVYAGETSSMAIDVNNTVYAWGSNTYDRMGLGSDPVLAGQDVTMVDDNIKVLQGESVNYEMVAKQTNSTTAGKALMDDYTFDRRDKVVNDAGSGAKMTNVQSLSIGEYSTFFYRNDGTLWGVGNVGASAKNKSNTYRVTQSSLGNVKATAVKEPVRVGTTDLDTLSLGKAAILRNDNAEDSIEVDAYTGSDAGVTVDLGGSTLKIVEGEKLYLYNDKATVNYTKDVTLIDRKSVV